MISRTTCSLFQRLFYLNNANTYYIMLRFKNFSQYAGLNYMLILSRHYSFFLAAARLIFFSFVWGQSLVWWTITFKSMHHIYI